MTITEDRIKASRKDRTFVDDIFDNWDRMVEKITCKKQKKKAQLKKKSKDAFVISEISTIVKSKQFKNVDCSKYSQTEFEYLLDKSKKAPLKQAVATNTDESRVCISSTKKTEKKAYKELADTLRELAKKQEEACIEKALDDLKSQDSFKERRIQFKCPQCERRKKIKHSESCTQFEPRFASSPLCTQDAHERMYSGASSQEEGNSLNEYPTWANRPPESSFWELYNDYRRIHNNDSGNRKVHSFSECFAGSHEEMDLIMPQPKKYNNASQSCQKTLSDVCNKTYTGKMTQSPGNKCNWENQVQQPFNFKRDVATNLSKINYNRDNLSFVPAYEVFRDTNTVHCSGYTFLDGST